MKKISAKKYAVSLYEVVEGANKDKVKEATENLLKVLIKNKSLKLVNKVMAEFDKYSKEQAGIKEATVITASPLSATLKKELQDQLKKVCQAEKIKLTEEIDENLIAGAVIKISDEILDASTRTRLQLLRHNLK